MDSTPAHTVNPAAGTHPISTRPGHLEAARHAARASLEHFPYYAARFGERSRMFGESDGAWLLTLCDGGPRHVRQQLFWLGAVLSSRGVPRWLLERHLAFLHEGLLAATDDAATCGWLPEGAAYLAEARDARIPAPRFQALAAEFAKAVGPEWAGRFAGMGEILLSAVADEADGIARAGTVMEQWALDPRRFPPVWVEAARATMEAARAEARGG